MRVTQDRGGHRLDIRKGGGIAQTVFGLPFIIAGLAVIAFTVGAIPVEGDAPPLFFGIPFGLVFALAGAGISLGRAATVIDNRHNTMEQWWGLLIPMHRKQYRLEDFNRVGLNKEVRRSKNSSYTVYPVRLIGDSEKTTVQEDQNYENARLFAERLAKFLFLPLADDSTGNEIVRQPDKLDQSVREQLLETGALPDLPEPPANMRTVVKKRERAIMLILPRAGIQPMLFVIAPIVLVADLIFAIVFFMVVKDAAPQLPAAILVLIVAAIALLPAAFLLRKALAPARKAVRVIVSPEDGLRYEEKSGEKTKIKEISSTALEEVLLRDVNATFMAANSTGKPPQFLLNMAGAMTAPIVACSDDERIEFGNGLNIQEARYLHALILHTLAG